MTSTGGGRSGAAFDAVAITKRLLREGRSGALATLMVGSGDPYCSLVNVATTVNGSPLLLISTLALHTKNLQADPRVCLLLEERPIASAHAEHDPLQAARIMLRGNARPDADPDSRRRYLARHADAAAFADFADFGIYRIEPTQTHLVAGFGRIVDLEPGAILTDLVDAQALVDAEADICAHMNEDHADALRLYAVRLLGGPDEAWRCVGCDPEGLDLQCGSAALRLPFPHRITTPGALRQILREMAEAARANA